MSCFSSNLQVSYSINIIRNHSNHLVPCILTLILNKCSSFWLLSHQYQSIIKFRVLLALSTLISGSRVLTAIIFSHSSNINNNNVYIIITSCLYYPIRIHSRLLSIIGNNSRLLGSMGGFRYSNLLRAV